MKVIEHEVTGKPQEMTLSFNPMVVWFDRHIEIKVEKGDTIKQIGQLIARYWGFPQKQAEGIAAYWFALGERRASKKKPGDWSAAELSQDPKRRYLRA